MRLIAIEEHTLQTERAVSLTHKAGLSSELLCYQNKRRATGGHVVVSFRDAKLFEVIGATLILLSVALWGRAINRSSDRLANYDRKILYASVDAVQDDVLRASAWLFGDKESREKDFDVIFSRRQKLAELKSTLDNERQEDSSEKHLQEMSFVAGSFLLILAKFMEWLDKRLG